MTFLREMYLQQAQVKRHSSELIPGSRGCWAQGVTLNEHDPMDIFHAPSNRLLKSAGQLECRKAQASIRAH